MGIQKIVGKSGHKDNGSMLACISRSPEIGDPVSGVHNTDYDH